MPGQCFCGSWLPGWAERRAGIGAGTGGKSPLIDRGIALVSMAMAIALGAASLFKVEYGFHPLGADGTPSSLPASRTPESRTFPAATTPSSPTCCTTLRATTTPDMGEFTRSFSRDFTVLRDSPSMNALGFELPSLELRSLARTRQPRQPSWFQSSHPAEPVPDSGIADRGPSGCSAIRREQTPDCSEPLPTACRRSCR